MANQSNTADLVKDASQARQERRVQGAQRQLAPDPATAAAAPPAPQQQQQPAAPPAAAAAAAAPRERPQRVSLVLHEGQKRQGSEGYVVGGTCDGVECFIKLLGPDRSGVAAFAREVAAYAALEPLQGLQVPELRAWGDIRWGVRFLAVRRVEGGRPLSDLPHPPPPGVAAAALEALAAVQAACPRFVHGDLRPENILVLQPGPEPEPAAGPGPAAGRAGAGAGAGGHAGPAAEAGRLRCVLLDFGRSRLDGDASQQRRERRELRQLLGGAR
ncbi:hypothetical protein HYH03_014323 [Edaphochlamys debaryana]|uniref:Protein kinase domain-containing protein n=1 Tax=Edaphochlamys debaryana TaxID=47281 RepID=A0A836BSF3_9CHLO|nr:hypothetical protein HYH03_014323 [Edaphochlamys debaryana]|eukprot:KAG2487077.1 hypothetical protein HYH03_014323 [Edaphochlamys debaryana]